MPESSAFAPGQPCWADVSTPDLAASRAFYGELFGWSFRDSGPEYGNYTMCLVGEATVAGLTPRQAESPSSPLWTLYLASPDVRQTAKSITASGGMVLMEPLEIPESGWMLYAYDPTGAPFGVWQAAGHIGTELYREPGAMCWAELNTDNGPIADAFYRSLFGYQQVQIGDGVEFDYTTWYLDHEAVCGRLRLPADATADVPSHWMTYFAVEDADAAVSRVRRLGGTAAREPVNSPFGRLCVVSDPHGAAFAVIAITADAR